MGLNVANNNNALLLNTLQNMFGNNLVLGNDNNIAFSEEIVVNKNSYTYPFFNYLTEKTRGYNNYKYIVEPLVKCDYEKIRSFFKGIKYSENLPFYLDCKKPNWQNIKSVLIEEVVTSTPSKAYIIAEQNQTIVSLIIANINNDKCTLNIVCDSEYYNSDLSHPIDFICRNIFEEFNVSKISTINNNVGIAFSGINSTLTISHFKPDYSLKSNMDGYSKIRYDLSKETNMEADIKIDNSKIKLVL